MKSFADFFNEAMSEAFEKYKEYLQQECANYKNAMQNANAAAQTAWGLCMASTDEEKLHCFENAAKTGYTPALYELGLWYRDGRGGNGSTDENKAVEYFKQAASKHYMPAKYALCLHEIKSLKDSGVNKEAVDILTNAMKMGLQCAQMQLMLKYPNAKFEQAKTMADVGFEPAIVMLGSKYLNDMIKEIYVIH